MQEKKINIHPAAAFCLMFAPLVAVLGLQIVGSFVAMEWGVAIAALGAEDYTQYMNRYIEFVTGMQGNMVILLFYVIMALILFTIWYRMVFHKGERFTNPFRGMAKRPIVFIFGVLVFVVGAQYLCSYIASGLGALFPSWMETYTELMENAGLTGDGMGVITMTYAVLLGPVVEELTFRGLTYNYARTFMPAMAANVVQAFLFGVLHGNMLQGAFAFVLGLLLGYVYEKYNNLLVTMILHMLYNGFAYIMQYISEMLLTSEEVEIAATQNFANPVYAASFAIFLFISMVVTYLGIVLLTKATQEKVNKNSVGSDI